MQLTFLGTSAMVPTKERNASAIYLDFEGEGILFDCGEGTQRQMNIAGINRQKVKKICISHWHGDHVAGLLGLIQTIGNIDNPPDINLFGPTGTKQRFESLMNSCIFDRRVNIKVTEINAQKPEVILSTQNYEILAVNLNHGVPCLGYCFRQKDFRKINMSKARKLGLSEGPKIGRLQNNYNVTHNKKLIKPDDVSKMIKGKKITVIMDTMQCKQCIDLADESDILIIESSYAPNLDEKAKQYKHMTSEQAAQIAHQANVKKLILTHFSQRYKTPQEIEKGAKDIFPEALCAFDFMKIKI